MRNASGSCWCSRVALLQQVLGPQAAPHGLAAALFRDAAAAASPGMEGGGGGEEVMRPPALLFRAFASVNLHLLIVYILLFALAKIFARLNTRASASWRGHGCDDRAETAEAEDEAAAADVVGGQRADTLFWFDEAVFEDTTTLLLGDEGKDHLMYTPATADARCLQVESTAFRTEESGRISPRSEGHHNIIDGDQQQQQQREQRVEAKDIAVDVTEVTDQQRDVPVVASPKENVSVEGNHQLAENEGGQEEDNPPCDADDEDRDDGHHHANEQTTEEEEEEDSVSEGHHVNLFVNNRALADTRKLLLEGGVVARSRKEGGVVAAGVVGGGAKLVQDEKERDRDSSRFGASTLTSESTSKSSVEWRSSTVTKDSETEYPFSSSSRRSSARWESYALFRRYDEDMVYFHRVGAQKLNETESFRSIKYQPRSMSERLVHKLAPKPSFSAAPPPIGLRDPYPELERAYVAQVCLTWEALNWNYTVFRRHTDGDVAGGCCPARVAQEFQQFQVLLHRFVENEPFECGRRPEVYARAKNATPKLLLVPEFREEEDEKDDLISALQFLLILEDSIRTFMTFLRADKRSHYEMFREMVKRRSIAGDHSLVSTLKKANKKKKSRLKDLTRPRRCLKRTKLREEEEMSILLGLIDLKVVARVLRVPDLTDQQLHWCEEKMNRIRVDPVEGKMQRDPSLLFFPAH